MHNRITLTILGGIVALACLLALGCGTSATRGVVVVTATPEPTAGAMPTPSPTAVPAAPTAVTSAPVAVPAPAPSPTTPALDDNRVEGIVAGWESDLSAITALEQCLGYQLDPVVGIPDTPQFTACLEEVAYD